MEPFYCKGGNFCLFILEYILFYIGNFLKQFKQRGQISTLYFMYKVDIFLKLCYGSTKV